MTDEPRMDIAKELRRLIREALRPLGGTGGKRECRYCLRQSFKGQPEHYRVGVTSEDGPESDDHCEVTIMRQALRELTR